MGIYDREYVREEYDRRPAMGGGRSMVVNIIIINAALFIANMIVSLFAENYLTYSLSANVYSLIRPWMWWQLLTSGFVHSPHFIWHILGNMLGLFFLGREVERVLGKWEFLRFYLIAIVVGCIVHTARVYFFIPEGMGAGGVPNVNRWAVPLLGASGGVTATVMLFVFMFPRMKVLLFFAIPIPAWVLGVLFVGYDAFGAMGRGVSGQNVAFDVHLAGAAFALMYYFFRWNIGKTMPRGLADAGQKMGASLRGKPKLRVHHGDDEYHSAEPDPHQQEDEEADRILAKIDREGMASLTDAERQALEAYSRRMQQKHR